MGSHDAQAGKARRRIAIVDPGSFFLPYVAQLAQALAGRGDRLQVWASATRYNADFLTVLAATPGVRLHQRAVSGSVAPRWRGVLAYLAQLGGLLRRARQVDVVNLQWVGAGVPGLDWLVFGVLLRCLGTPFVLTVHNAVPHGFTGLQHGPTRRLAARADRLLFLSQATLDDFVQRYGQVWRARCELLPHGLMPAIAGAARVPYAPLHRPEALVFWGRVQPYKGVELFAELARSDALRARGLQLLVCGAWAPELQDLRDELCRLGVQLHEGYLEGDALRTLLGRRAVFILPYARATQSGVMYALLHHGRTFFCADSGDLGGFMRAHGLTGLLLGQRPTAHSVLQALDHLQANADAVARALSAAQSAMDWPQLLERYPAAYDAPR